jgi:uncharacterized protein (TIGR03083 family)
MTSTCHVWQHEGYCDALAVEIAFMADLLRDAHPTTPVPACPDWTITDLVKHVGGVHRWAARMVREQTSSRIAGRLIKLALPRKADDYPGWLADGGNLLVATLRAAEPDAPMWAWGADQHVRFWSRRMLHETTVHRTDAEQALGREPSVETRVAVDGIDELLDNLPGAAYFAANVTELRGNGESLQCLATDTGDTWLIELQPDRFTWSHGSAAQAQVSVTLRGTAPDLYLLLWRRCPVENARFELAGEASVLKRWLDKSAV